MLKLPHFRVSNVRPTKIGVNVTLEILDEDISTENELSLRQFWKDGNPMTGIIQEIAPDPLPQDEAIGPLVSNLHYKMQKYCEKEKMNFEEYNKRFKAKYNVSRKNEMSIEDLKKEISRHEAGLL